MECPSCERETQGHVVMIECAFCGQIVHLPRGGFAAVPKVTDPLDDTACVVELTPGVRVCIDDAFDH